MHPAETFRDTLPKLVPILERLGVGFHLTGGVATIAYGEPRMTKDIDYGGRPPAVLGASGGVSFGSRSSGLPGRRGHGEAGDCGGGLFQLLDLAESLKVDLYPREMIPDELDRSV